MDTPTPKYLSILSWITTSACIAYMMWIATRFGDTLPAMKTMYSDLGLKLPRQTEIVMAIPTSVIWTIVVLATVLLVWKELKLKSKSTCVAITFSIYMIANFLASVIADALMKPLFGVVETLGQQT
jgi:hypothetical protein